MKDLIETAKGFSIVEKEKKVQGDHKTLWEAAKNFELLDEKVSPRVKKSLDNFFEGLIDQVEDMIELEDARTKSDRDGLIEMMMSNAGEDVTDDLEELLKKEMDFRYRIKDRRN